MTAKKKETNIELETVKGKVNWLEEELSRIRMQNNNLISINEKHIDSQKELNRECNEQMKWLRKLVGSTFAQERTLLHPDGKEEKSAHLPGDFYG